MFLRFAAGEVGIPVNPNNIDPKNAYKEEIHLQPRQLTRAAF